MASTTTDRLAGVTAGLASKAPVRAATTANITLSGEQTIDGVAVVADDRVLVKDQTDGTENGIYDAAAGAWTRAKDFDGTRDVAPGTFTVVVSGGTNGGSAWRVTTTGTITVGTTSIAFAKAIWSSASDTTAIATGTTTAISLADRFAQGYITPQDEGAVGDDTTDDGPAFRSAIAIARAAGIEVRVPYAKYYINSVSDGVALDVYRCGLVGMHAEDGSATGTNDGGALSNTSVFPVLRFGSAVTNCIRVGQSTDAQVNLVDRTPLRGFALDISDIQNSGKAVFCAFGVQQKPILDLIVRDTTNTTRAAIITADKSAFDFRIATSGNGGIYYCYFDNLDAFNCQRGFWTSGATSDGLRVSWIGAIRVWNCNQGITFKDSTSNWISWLGLQSRLSGYDSTGASPADWAIWMDYRNNTIGNVYLEAVDNDDVLIFSSFQHTWLQIRELDRYPNVFQAILEDGTRVNANYSSADMPGNIMAGTSLETSSIGGPQTQPSLTDNPHFQFWEGGGTDVNDADTFAHVWTVRKDEATATLRVTQTTGSSNTIIHDSSVHLGVTSPVADTLYGISQDLANNFPISGSLLTTVNGWMNYATVVVICRPFSTNSAEMRVRIEVDQGVASSNENYVIEFDGVDDADVDEPVVGRSGDWWSLVHRVDVNSNGTKFDVAFGIYQTGTANAEIHVDGIYVVQGRHTQYGARPLVEPARLIATTGITANAKTFDTPTHQLLIFDKDGVAYYVPASTTAPNISPTTDSITSGTTQTQAGATALTAAFNRVTTHGNVDDGVKLPTAAAGLTVTIVNDTATGSLQVWPNTSDAIEAGAVDAVGVTKIGAGGSLTYTAIDATTWYISSVDVTA